MSAGPLTPKEHRHALVGPPKLWQMKREFQIRFLRAQGLSPWHFLLDLGCGTLRGGIPLIEHLDKGHYYGVEVRCDVLDEGRRELSEAGCEWKEPSLHCTEDLRTLSLKRRFDFIWSFSVLFHMTDSDLDRALGFVSRHLKEDGAFFANVNVGPEKPDGVWQGFPVVWRSFDFYQEKCGRVGLSMSDLGSLNEHGHNANVTSQDAQRMLKITKA